jgi:arsenate reductase (thioredoxin)
MAVKRAIKVLFVCRHNSARSQMAEAFLEKLGGDRYQVESAGLEPGELNPMVVEVMQEEGIDISGKKTDSVFELFKAEREYDFVITVCDEAASESCPVFPGRTFRLRWGFPDPSGFAGSREEKLDATRKVRDQVKNRIQQFIDEMVM